MEDNFIDKVSESLDRKSKLHRLDDKDKRFLFTLKCHAVRFKGMITRNPEIFFYCEDIAFDDWCWAIDMSTDDELTTIYFINEQAAVLFKLRFNTA